MSSLCAFRQNVTESVICFVLWRHIPPRTGARSNANCHPVFNPLLTTCSWIRRTPNISISLSVISEIFGSSLTVRALYGTFQSVSPCVATRAWRRKSFCTVPCRVCVLFVNDTIVPGGNFAPAKSAVTMLVNPLLLVGLFHDNQPPRRC